METIPKTMSVCRSFEESEADDLQTYAAMSPADRLALVERLRQSYYGYSDDQPARFQYVLSVSRRK